MLPLSADAADAAGPDLPPTLGPDAAGPDLPPTLGPDAADKTDAGVVAADGPPVGQSDAEIPNTPDAAGADAEGNDANLADAGPTADAIAAPDGHPPDLGAADGDVMEVADRCATAACSRASNDGCCPAGCTAGTDVDCNGCGNGRLEAGETCDPPESCPTTCTSAICTKAHLEGKASTCNATCVSDPITQCVSGDNCCPGAAKGCTGANDTDCLSVCGNGIKEPGESCDPISECQTAEKGCTSDANYVETKSGDATKCTFSCAVVPRSCIGGDNFCPTACNATTDSDCTGCGNGRVESGETCDPPSKCGADQTACVSTADQVRTSKGTISDCTFACTSKPRACVAGDGFCPSTCTPATDSDCPGCGNGKVETGEKCDPLSTCPTACPANGCMRRKLSGAGTCAATCVDDTPISVCLAGDGCCPSTCHAGNDSDCSAVCGDARDGICPASCTYTQDADCKLVGGATCNVATPAQCQSGSCVDSRCCTQSCGACSACTGPGGTCVAIKNTEDADSCSGDRTCNSNGACKLKDGADCTDPTDCASGQCTRYYRDMDADFYADKNTSIRVCGDPAIYRNGYIQESRVVTFDCCDVDANTFPGQQNYFISRNECHTFDFNCDGAETPQWTDLFGCTCPCQGWSGTSPPMVPSCGTPAIWAFCSTSAGGGTGRTQSCR